MKAFDLMLLAVVRDDGASYGLDICRKAEGRLGQAVNAGALYRSLRRLERHGLVSARWENRRMASPHRGSHRRYYFLTSEGGIKLAQHADVLDRLPMPLCEESV